MDVETGSFVWDADKELSNIRKHSIGFTTAAKAFMDPRRRILRDLMHGAGGCEDRFFCFGKVGQQVLTVRFTWRDGRIRIYGAGCWRKGRRIYEGPRS